MVSKSKKIAFCTHVSDDWFWRCGADKLLKTFKHYNPDIPFFVFGGFELNQLNHNYGGVLNWDIIHPFVTNQILKLGYELVVHVDADSIIVSNMSHLVHESGDVLTVRNNNDKGFASKDNNPPITIKGCDAFRYMNAGFVGVRSQEFLNEWMNRNLQEAGNYPYQEQDILNIILQEGNYLVKCLDPLISKAHYGISVLNGTTGYWDNLKDLELSYLDGKASFSYNNKRVCVIHQAGGHSLPKMVLPDLFQGKVLEELEYIVNSKPVSFEKPQL